ncbi:MAG: hypothetical protein CME61_08820 [Halobacteriovoraceae bacterium]|nr:hypothetical protein [Halobacteriovoraceae bacterium]OUX68091.1 MAG: hypothetical protein CBD38_00550 [bacterium TMED178]
MSVEESDPRVLEGALNMVEALQAQLDKERLAYQLYKTVAMNRLEVVYDALGKAASANGLSALEVQLLMGSVEKSMLLLETDAEVRLCV